MRRIAALMTALVLILAGCGDAGDDIAEHEQPTTTQPETTTQATLEPTTTAPPPAQAAEEVDAKVDFDGETCTYQGPVAVPDGTEVGFEFDTTYEAPAYAAASLLVASVADDTTWDQVLEYAATHPANQYPPFAAGVERLQFGPGILAMTLQEGKYVVACNRPDTMTSHPAVLIEVIEA